MCMFDNDTNQLIVRGINVSYSAKKKSELRVKSS